MAAASGSNRFPTTPHATPPHPPITPTPTTMPVPLRPCNLIQFQGDRLAPSPGMLDVAMFEKLETPFNVTVWRFDKSSRLTFASPILQIPGVVNIKPPIMCGNGGTAGGPARTHDGCNIVDEGWLADHRHRPSSHLAFRGHRRVRRGLLCGSLFIQGCWHRHGANSHHIQTLSCNGEVGCYKHVH
jgi:hypothetical protein